MKIFLSFSAVLLFASLLVAGCKKVPDQLVDAGYMTATVGGASYNASSSYESFALTGTEDFYIKGTGTDGTSFIVIRIRASRLYPGDYSLDGWHSAWYVTNGATVYSDSGNVHISSDSAGVATSGSFNFTTHNGPDITNGSFRAVFH